VNEIRKRLDFQVRAGLVFDAIYQAHEPLSMLGVAMACGMSRSPYLREIVDTLLSRGYIERGFDRVPSGQPVIVYWAVKSPDWSD